MLAKRRKPRYKFFQQRFLLEVAHARRRLAIEEQAQDVRPPFDSSGAFAGVSMSISSIPFDTVAHGASTKH
ncbi:hypothetical protein [Paraburkholderia aromaticivorans]|uniref:hypothetical protein n=1 Tax=Paraburkholderia aromaticivorans TaxID=2026199 RepID=UPI001455EED8|nr:hypothetical protein [Paraburkholderia aromaticivorans]